MRSMADNNWVLSEIEFLKVVIKLKESYLKYSFAPPLEEDELLISFILIILVLRSQPRAEYGVDL